MKPTKFQRLFEALSKGFAGLLLLLVFRNIIQNHLAESYSYDPVEEVAVGQAAERILVIRDVGMRLI